MTSNLTVTAKWTINSYTVTFVADGQTLKIQAVEHGQAAIAPPDPTKKEHTFDGWDKYFSYIMGDLTVNATWKANTYTVTFIVDGETVETQEVDYGKAATPSDPVKTGYTFDGWNKDFSNITGNLTVTAKWKINTYTVAFKDGDAVLKTQTIEHGQGAAAPANPSKTGHSFDGWDTDFSNITSDLTVTAKWKANTYTVTFIADGETVETQEVDYGKAATPSDPVKTGYTFDGWNKDFSNITGDLMVTAKWKINTYTVTFKDGDTVLKTQTIEHGQGAAAPANPSKTGYSFDGWDKDFGNVTSDLTVTAKWKAIPVTKYTVTFVVDGKTVSTQTIEKGKSAVAPPNPSKTGYSFDGWDKDFGNVTSDLTVTAKWKAIPVTKYTVTFVVDGKTVSTQTIEKGKSAVAPPNPSKTGYTFDGWDKAFNNITGNLMVTAKWKINTYKVTFKNGSKTLKTQTVDYGKAATAPKNPTKKNNLFNGWNKKFNNITGNLTVSAQWKKVTAPTKKVTGYKLSSPESKQLKVVYKKVSGANGYRIQYSTSKKYTKKATKTVHTTKTSYTIKKLKAKTRYYVKVTAYKTDSQKNKLYSKKSATKNLKTK